MGGKIVEETFIGSTSRVFIAAQRSVSELGFAVLHSDPAGCVITFNTGRSMKSWAGQDLSVTVFEEGSEAKVVVGGSLAKGGNPFGGGQVASWGEKRKLSLRFLDHLRTVLPSVPEPSTFPKAETESVAAQLAQLAELYHTGAISDVEFGAAKAKLLA